MRKKLPETIAIIAVSGASPIAGTAEQKVLSPDMSKLLVEMRFAAHAPYPRELRIAATEAGRSAVDKFTEWHAHIIVCGLFLKNLCQCQTRRELISERVFARPIIKNTHLFGTHGVARSFRFFLKLGKVIARPMPAP